MLAARQCFHYARKHGCKRGPCRSVTRTVKVSHSGSETFQDDIEHAEYNLNCNYHHYHAGNMKLKDHEHWRYSKSWKL